MKSVPIAPEDVLGKNFMSHTHFTDAQILFIKDCYHNKVNNLQINMYELN